MEVVAAATSANGGAGGGVSPFHNHDVCEWSCVDSLTGVLERARRETDHWAANTNNSTHKYGKVVDCRARSGVDGNLQQAARRQFEVFQSQIPGGRLQVIKTHSISSSRWTNKFQQKSHDLGTFEDLHLNLNTLDVTCQKSKAILARSNVGRRPPSRQQQQRDRDETTTTTSDKYEDAAPSVASLHKVSRLCRQIHDNAVKQYIHKPSAQERHQQRGEGGVNSDLDGTNQLKRNETRSKATRTPSSSTTSSEDSHSTQNNRSTVSSSSSSSSSASSSSSSNDKEKESTKRHEDLEKLTKDWRRSKSKLRRSFQNAGQNKACQTIKPGDLPENNGSVRTILEDIEKGRRLNAALRGSNVNLEAIDQILQSIENRRLDEYKNQETAENAIASQIQNEQPKEILTKSKRNSFVTVESIKEVRDRLRRTTSPVIDDWMHKRDAKRDGKEQLDDGIVTEMSKTSPLENNIASSKVRSYVYGMEDSLARKSMNGTGSLESRSNHLANNSSACRNGDWFNRRKSYGFERMHNQVQDENIAKTKTADSSTDSGICRSSEIPTNTPEESSGEHCRDPSFECNNYNCEKEKWQERNVEDSPTNNAPVVSPYAWKLLRKELNDGGGDDDLKRHSIAVDESKYVIRTTEPRFRRTSLVANTSDLHHFSSSDADSFLLQGRRPKKVEFCKTEVHFTAESGKVNIVETDEKPPPTNNFRRRRRSSALILDEFSRSDGLPVFKFGDDIFNDENIAEDFTNEEDALQNISAGLVTVNSSANDARRENDEDPREISSEIDLPKGILKNKLTRPKPYILGDCENYLSRNLNSFEATDSGGPWNVQLSPIKTEATARRSTDPVRNTFVADGKTTNGDFDIGDDPLKTDADLPEFQKLLRNLRPVTKSSKNIPDSFNGIRIVSPSTVDTRTVPWSVIDRIKLVEDQQQHSTENKGYSTKVNIGNGEATVIENNADKRLNKHPTWPRKEETSHDLNLMQSAVDTKAKRTSMEGGTFERRRTQVTGNHVDVSKSSGVRAVKNPSSLALPSKAFSSSDDGGTKLEIINKLSSPALVGKSTLQNETLCDSSTVEEGFVTKTKSSSERRFTKKSSLERPSTRIITETLAPHKIRSRSPGKEILRQPKKSEMAYFGVPVSPLATRKPTKQNKLSERPDLLQFAESNTDPAGCSTERERHPTYENLECAKKRQAPKLLARGKRDFDSSILEELTRAADQILQAVNGYTDEDSESNRNLNSREPLDTISETKSWKQRNPRASNVQRPSQNKTNVGKIKATRLTSSNSSVESAIKETRKSSKSSEHKLSASTSSGDAKNVARKISNHDNNATAKANVKARRLQRASSREALLQSRGSSSEDLPVVVQVPLRKPRLARKNKSGNSVTTDNSLEGRRVQSEGPTNRREDSSSRNKSDMRVPAPGLPEIRHKTAVSTIRSTAERAAVRQNTEKSKTSSESKRRPLQRRDPRGVSAAAATRNDKSKSSTGRENSGQPHASSSSSTALAKKSIRYEAS